MGHKPSVNLILLPFRWVVSNVVWLSVDHHNLTLEWLSAIVLAWPTQCRSRGRRTSTSGQLPITYALPGRLVLMCLDYRKHSLPGAFWWVLLPFPLFPFLYYPPEETRNGMSIIFRSLVSCFVSACSPGDQSHNPARQRVFVSAFPLYHFLWPISGCPFPFPF